MALLRVANIRYKFQTEVWSLTPLCTVRYTSHERNVKLTISRVTLRIVERPIIVPGVSYMSFPRNFI